MPKIEIVEIDATTPGVLAESNEVVYVPGFVDVEANFQNPEDALEVNKPHLFTSISGFESLCGTRGAEFKTNQLFSSLSRPWAPAGRPVDDVLIRASADAPVVDPGYVMAKELLAAGLNVMYERVNPDKYYAETTTNTGSEGEERASTVFTTELLDKPELGLAPVAIGDAWDSNVNYYRVAEGDNLPTGYNHVYQLANPTTEDVVDGKFVKQGYFTDPGYALLVQSSATEAITDYIYAYEAVPGVFYFLISDPTSDEYAPIVDGKQYGGKYYGLLSILKSVDSYYVVDPDWETQYWTNGVRPVKQYLPVGLSVSGTVGYGNDSSDAPEGVSRITLTAFDEFRHPESAFTANFMYNALSGVYGIKEDGIADKGNYNIKYLTSGGYPVYEYDGGSIVTAMLNLAETRGDCYALIDPTDKPDRDLNLDRRTSLYYAVSNDTALDAGGEYGAMFTPWCVFNRTTNDTELVNGVTKLVQSPRSVRMPASFGYLLALADSIKTNASWLAVAGVARGIVPNLATNGITVKIPNGVADKMQPRTGMSINAITNIKSYGETIWGNRTLKRNAENLVATSFLNIRNMMCDIKKVCYTAARSLTFEQNTEVLWVNLKSKIAPTLDRMMSGYGISGYKIVRDTTHEKAAEKATLCAKIILYPVYAVEDFYITITLTDDEVTVQ